MKDYFNSVKTSEERKDLEEMKQIFNSMLATYDSGKSHEEKMDEFAAQEQKLNNFLKNYKNAR